jgi:membrane protease YdiL (CAAX protease family)
LLILDLYFIFIPSLLENPFLQFAGLLAFFPLAFFITKWVGLSGLKGIGLIFHRGWFKNFFLSFCIGFFFWLLMYVIQFFSGDLEWNGIRKSSEILMPLLIILVGFFMGSIINDLIVRGYVISFLQGKLPIVWVFTISILIYALDDYWYAGFSLSNLLFSVLLGLSLTYAFYKTGSIWANTGIHYGLNVAYGLFFGMVGNPGTSIFIIKENVNQTTVGAISHYLIPAIMFLFLLMGMKFYYKNTNHNNNNLPFSV